MMRTEDASVRVNASTILRFDLEKPFLSSEWERTVTKSTDGLMEILIHLDDISPTYSLVYLSIYTIEPSKSLSKIGDQE